jgi:hypothetical protein
VLVVVVVLLLLLVTLRPCMTGMHVELTTCFSLV